MTLRTQPVPSPALGNEWSYAVPGQYIFDVLSVQATLTAGYSGPSTVNELDVTGNGNTLLVSQVPPANLGQVLDVEGAVVGNGALRAYIPSGGSGVSAFGLSATPTVGMTWDADWTIECWVNQPNTLLNLVHFIANFAFPFPFVMLSIENNRDPYLSIGGQLYNTPTVIAVNSGWHHIVWVFRFAGVVNCYIDGVSGGVVNGPAVGFRTAMDVADIGLVTGGTNNQARQTIDEYAIYPVALTGGQVAAHYAAAASGIAAYEAAILADSPAAYWHFDATVPETDRNPMLTITNGTDTVGQYPAPIAQNDNDVVQYTWLAGAKATSSTANPAVVTITTPPLILPAGYTFEMSTFGLQSVDQWSNITIWWDDDVMAYAEAIDPYKYPPGAKLVYQQRPDSGGP